MTKIDKEINIFEEYNDICAKENNIYKSRLIKPFDNGFDDINDFKLNKVWNKIYNIDKKYQDCIIKIITSVMAQLQLRDDAFYVTGPSIKGVLLKSLDLSRDDIIKELHFNIVCDRKINKSLLKHNNIKKANDSTYICDDLVSQWNGKIFIHMTSNNSLASGLFGLPHLDRIAFYKNKFMISGTLSIEVFKTITMYNKQIKNRKLVDPFLNLPIDPLGIRKQSIINAESFTIKKHIDMVNPNISHSVDLDSFIKHSQFRNKITVMEYALIKFHTETNNVLKCNLGNIIRDLNSHVFPRNPIYFADVLGLDVSNHEIYILLEHGSSKYPQFNINISCNCENDCEYDVEINKKIIIECIKNDDVNYLSEYLGWNKIESTFAQLKESYDRNSWASLIQIMIQHKSDKIEKYFIKSDCVTGDQKLQLAFITERLDYIEEIKNSDCIDNIDCINDIFYNYLRDIIHRGLRRSFYYLLKLDYIGVLNFKDDINDGNILHNLCCTKLRGTGSNDIFKIVMKLKPELINETDKNNNTPLMHYASIRECDYSLIELALEYEITNIKLINSNGDTFFNILCQNGNTDAVNKCIRKAKTIINVSNNNGETPAITSCKNKHEDIFHILKVFNVDLNAKDVHNNTVYHYICQNRLCIGYTIPNNINRYGYSPMDYCGCATSYYNFL